jgi:hypothetical protein
MPSHSFTARRASLALLGALTAASLGCAGEAPCEGEAQCGGLAAIPPAPPPAGAITADFRAHFHPGTRTLTFERVDVLSGAPGAKPQDLTDLQITQDTIPGSGPANSVELVTNTVGYDTECPVGYQSKTFCGNVTLRHFYGLPLSDVHVQVTRVTDLNDVAFPGHGGVNNDPSLHGLDASQGLWKYTSAAGTCQRA